MLMICSYINTYVEDIAQAVDKLNKDPEFIPTWALKFGLTVNPNKCQAIIVGS